MKRILTYFHGLSVEQAQKLLFGTGLFGFFLTAAALLFRLTGAPAGDFGAIQNMVGAYVEHALACLLCPLAAAASIAVLARKER